MTTKIEVINKQTAGCNGTRTVLLHGTYKFGFGTQSYCFNIGYSDIKCVTLKKIPISICDCAFIIQDFAYAYFILQIHHNKIFKMRYITYLYFSYLPMYS